MPASDPAGTPSRRGARAYRIGVALALVTAVVTLWTTVVRDDGHGIGFIMLVLAAAIGSWAAGFRPAGMARAMVGVAIMQILLGLLIATEPVTARINGAPLKILVASGVLATLWLLSALLFRAATTRDHRDETHP